MGLVKNRTTNRPSTNYDKCSSSKKSGHFTLKWILQHSMDFIRKKIFTFKVLYEPECFPFISYSLLLFEIILNVIIINRVPYTEIDWSTYMQQVECFLNGTLDYDQIQGDTGPIVYPAGHLYIYTILYAITNRGSNIYLAQYIFAMVYVVTLFVVFELYGKYCGNQVPPFALIFMCLTSYRIHSIYVLRLFNDTIAMLLLYWALWFFITKKWTFGSIFFSLATSIKMNILLFAPGLFLLFNEYQSKFEVIKNLSLCAFVQVILALPFLTTYPISYIKKSFNLGRVFMHKWTVNYRFLPEDIFVHHGFHLTLLILHIMLLLFVFKRRWLGLVKNLLINQHLRRLNYQNNDKNFGSIFLGTMFTSNFIGIVCARSLHYQFYIWYYHSLSFILWTNSIYKITTKICMLGLVELVWNIYPSTVWSSALLHLVHLAILYGIFQSKKLDYDNEDEMENKAFIKNNASNNEDFNKNIHRKIK